MDFWIPRRGMLVFGRSPFGSFDGLRHAVALTRAGVPAAAKDEDESSDDRLRP